MISHYVPGDLSMTADPRAAQWADAKMLMIDDPDATFLSANNGTYFLILVQTSVKGTADSAVVALRLASMASNRTSQLWFWSSMGSGGAMAIGEVTDENAAIVFGAPLNPGNPGIELKVGAPYHDLIELDRSGNSSDPATLSFAHSVPFSFELVPYMDHYPKIPLVYSAIIVVVGVWFIIAEDRKHRKVNR